MMGEWNSQVKFYFQPGTPPMESNGTYTAKLDLGGYFLHREFEVELDSAADFKGLAFHGRALTGYDPYQKKYIGVWADSGSPAIYRTEGAFNKSGNLYTEISEGPDPGKPMKFRMTTELWDQDHMLFRCTGVRMAKNIWLRKLPTREGSNPHQEAGVPASSDRIYRIIFCTPVNPVQINF
jgi:hypothetical protein